MAALFVHSPSADANERRSHKTSKDNYDVSVEYTLLEAGAAPATEIINARLLQDVLALGCEEDLERQKKHSFSYNAYAWIEAITARDFPIIQGFVVVIATAYVLINLAVDVSYAYLDPRIRLE